MSAEPIATTTSPARRAANFLFVVDEYVGHLHGVLGLAKRLMEAGHNVLFIGSRTSAAILRRENVLAMEETWLPLASPRMSWSSLFRRRSTIERRLVVLKHGRERIASIVRDVRPDLVIFDPFVLEYYPFFWEHNVRAVSVSTKPLFSFDPAIPPYTSLLVPDQTPMGRLRVLGAWAYRWIVDARDRLEFALRRLITGLAPRVSHRFTSRMVGYPLSRNWRTRPIRFDLRLADVPEIVLQAREFDFPRVRPLDPHAHFVGPCVDLRDVDADCSAYLPPGDGPLILCSLGTVRRVPDRMILNFYRHVIDAVASDQRYRLVIATGAEEEARVLQSRVPAGVTSIRVHGWLPQTAILRRASLIISHGGGSSLKEAIALGVPMIVYPRRADQPGCAARVVYHGLGLAAAIHSATPASISKAIDHVIANPTFKRRCEEMSQHFKAYDQNNVAVRKLCAFAAGEAA
ncbi:nucleotide disphospho-sugar-binding domain-containing protein [Bradyrhizobium sp. BR 10261]|uniref:nucleotide disphospho-sugar-binding domain-containing protein n=1 Tax=Bradyrhizobium sp. BR 10261 TaxID=2749992 RepID=UPI001C64B3B5|nr:nucleotide disphospho-sugar-binding domain-containing protein [Bradyrhizobium sp. BR 10261]MBW7967163.1 glycosyltransferase [Bradyrhizobium sp. BR 10261]